MSKYIDADAFIQKIQRVLDENNDASFADNISREAFEIIIGGLKKTPAADVQEVRHGTYINTNHGGIHGDCIYRCSCCGNEREAYIEEENYCPNCGAKMDGGVGENAEHY